jgi:hypothetical protein
MQKRGYQAHALTVLVALLAMWPASGAAQSDTSAGRSPPAHVCWRGKPAPRCSSFWITEMGFDFVNSSTTTAYTIESSFAGPYTFRHRDFTSRFTWTVGPMFNTGPTRAVGGTLSISPVNDGVRAALEGRRRWWLTGGNAIDLSAGLLRADVTYPVGAQGGLTAGAYVVGGDYVNVNGRIDWLVTGGHQRVGTSAGIGVGSQLAAGGTAVLGLLVLAVAVAIIREGGAY